MSEKRCTSKDGDVFSKSLIKVKYNKDNTDNTNKI